RCPVKSTHLVEDSTGVNLFLEIELANA
ncbi:MAG: hypothetical protein RLZZ522_1189, partial [Verrucomicrobiota bacterium]